MQRWNIRAAQESDIEQLTQLRLALQEYLERCNPHLWRLSADRREYLRNQLIQLLSDEDALTLVALNDNVVIVGMIAGRVNTSEHYIPPRTGSINTLFVSEPWRRRGIGAELVKSLCRFFASRGVEDICVRYVTENAEATRFWSELGFQPRIVTAGAKLSDLQKSANMRV